MALIVGTAMGEEGTEAANRPGRDRIEAGDTYGSYESTHGPLPFTGVMHSDQSLWRNVGCRYTVKFAANGPLGRPTNA